MAGLGRKVFTAGDVLTASDVQNYLQDQAVMVFAGTAARSSAIATPSEGMFAITTNDDELDYYNGSAWVPALPLGSWTSYTPTLGGVTVGNGISVFGYQQIGKVIHVRGNFTLGINSAITGSITVSLPVQATGNFSANVSGNVIFIDAGTASYSGVVRHTNTTTVSLNTVNAAGTYTTFVATSATIPFTWVSTDSFSFSATYEAA